MPLASQPRTIGKEFMRRPDDCMYVSLFIREGLGIALGGWRYAWQGGEWVGDGRVGIEEEGEVHWVYGRRD